MSFTFHGIEKIPIKASFRTNVRNLKYLLFCSKHGFSLSVEMTQEMMK
jgi:hypothetical protein